MANIAETERKAVCMADGILAAVNENGNIDRFIDTKGGVHYIEPKRYEESVAKIDAAATKAKETVNSATEAVSECKAQTGACTQETARAKEIADTVESRITGIEGDVAALRDSVSRTIYGSKIISTASGNPTPLIFTTDEYMQLVGHAYTATTDHVSFANGDWSAQETRVASAIFGGGNIYVGLVNSPRNGRMRIDYAITTMA